MNDLSLDSVDNWVSTGGGPLIVLPRALLPYWNGADDAGTEVVPIPEGSPTDYDRACRVSGRVGVLGVGPGEALVLGHEPLDTRWWRTAHRDPTYLIRWVVGDSDESVLKALQSVEKAPLVPTGLVFHNISEEVLLFDSAMPGTDILTPYGSTPLPAGRYDVDIGEHAPDERTKVLVVRLNWVRG